MTKWTDEALTEFLKTKEVSPGMRKKKVDCPGIVKAIRKEYNDIVWVSASIDGSRLKIQIKENEDTFQEEVQETEEVSENLAMAMAITAFKNEQVGRIILTRPAIDMILYKK